MSSSSPVVPTKQEQVTERNLLDQIVDEGRIARDQAGR
jgi:hypothetical protein